VIAIAEMLAREAVANGRPGLLHAMQVCATRRSFAQHAVALL
jgi:hypothetical protein